ncbi:MAG: adenylate/guanylate cyclase domain-containing protein, partial [Candidatus Entotheonellia bacterium]
LDEAEAIALEACEPSRKTQDWGHYSVALSGLASVAVARGNFAPVERYAHESMLMVSRSRYPWGGARALYALACARALRGAWSEAEDALDMLLEPGRVFKDVGPIIRAFVQVFRQLLRGHAGALEAAGETSALDLVATLELDHSAVAPVCAMIELGDLLGDPALTQRPYQALTLALERGILFSNGWVFLLPRVLGVGAALSHRWDTAEAHFQAAIEAAARTGARPELGRTYLDYARMLVARGARGDGRHASELLQQASPILHELGMDPFARRATLLAERLQTSIPLTSQPRATPPDHLNAREVEVLLHMAQGHTDQEISDTLLLGSKTVARHIDSLFKKLGVESAAAAAAYAREKGLTPHPPPHRGREASPAIDPSPPPQLTQALRIILVTDMEGSTALIQRWGDAQAHELLRMHNTIIRDGLHQYHGFEVTHTGDGIEASFASAVSAVECAIFIQRAFARHNGEHPDRPIHVRIGINAGEPIPTEGRLFGTAVHTAFRICARARPGQIMVSDVVRQLAAGQHFAMIDRGRFALKGLPKRIRLYEVLWQDERA